MSTLNKLTPNHAKKLAHKALTDAGVPFTKLRAKTRSFEGLGYGSAVFVTPVGARVPDPRLNEAKAALKGSGAILDVPMMAGPEGRVIE